ncbi:uncharacterized protein N7483_000159 [Penicillium malachiteum]|uniref:uncharacterized protein n=1 Tax=Penicillium malachiteum TaxID=1324776 RepID=UPI002549258F|nr:uncharacterized protein N7483_000159 [Penicillium malachiteum]KAJ5735034.1 hypothetical protein N7483_000159 [Penicillium malachiteum]
MSAFATERKRDNVERQVHFKMGKAKYISIVDGGLVDPSGICHAPTEVKPQALEQGNIRQVLMQHALEFVAWIAEILGFYGISGWVPKDKILKIKRCA